MLNVFHLSLTVIEGYSFSYFLENLQYGFLQRALISTIIVGIACGVIGVFIILKGLSFLGAGIAHSCFAGGALALLLGIDPFFSILLFGEGTAMIIGVINEKKSTGQYDTVVGIMFSFTMALAILFISLSTTYNTDVNSLLFGNALTVSQENLNRLFVVSGIILVLFALLKKELLFITFDEEMAKVAGVPVRFLNYLFLAMIAGVITVSLKGIGAILVFAMIVTPAAAAYQWTYNTTKMILLSAFFGAFSAVVGVTVSFIYDLPTGSSVVLTVTLIFLISFMLSPKRKVPKETSYTDQQKHKEECKYCRDMGEDECPYCQDEMQTSSSPMIHHHDHSHVHSSHEHTH